MKTLIKKVFSIGMLSLACAPVFSLAQAAWPDKPIRFVVPYTPGGATDIVTRLIAQKMTEDTKWTFIVDNRAGGSGNIGIDVVAKAKPDGYTIAMGQTSNLAINPGLFAKMPYDALRDLVPVSVIASQPMVLVVRQDAQFRSLADLIVAAKAKPGEIKQALAATGTLGHMAGEVLAKRTGIKMLNVPYKGAAPAITDLLGGQTDFMFATPQAVLPMIKGGRLRALAVTSAKRLLILPEIPTVAESYKGFEAVDWKAIVVPAGTPADVVKKLNAAAEKALSKPATIAQLFSEGSAPVGGNAEQALQYIKSEQAKWATVIYEAGIKLE